MVVLCTKKKIASLKYVYFFEPYKVDHAFYNKNVEFVEK